MRLIFIALVMLLHAPPVALAQRRAAPVPPGYTEAQQAFLSLDPDQRIRLKVLLTGAGYWVAIPTPDFSKRLFEAITRFQIESGFPPTGYLDERQFATLVNRSRPNFSSWDFRA